MSGVGGVLAVVVPTALGSSVASTLITTYATQSRERKAARVEVRRAMRAAQSVAYKVDTRITQLQETLDEFVRAAQLAQLPVPLVDLYVCAAEQVWRGLHTPEAEWTRATTQATAVETAYRVLQEAFRLLVSATWLPHGSKVRVWRDTRRYRRVLVGGIPELDRKFGETWSHSRNWERDMLRKERRERKLRRKSKLSEQTRIDRSEQLDERPTSTAQPG